MLGHTRPPPKMNVWGKRVIEGNFAGCTVVVKRVLAWESKKVGKHASADLSREHVPESRRHGGDRREFFRVVRLR